MQFHTKCFSDLTTHELYEILRARADVFTTEEKILYPDADGLDYDALHVFAQDQSGKVTAYLRMFPKRDEPGVVQMGRVLTRVHGVGAGRLLIAAALDAAKSELHASEIYVESQKHAEGFYAKLGFVATSDDFIEAEISHVQMRKKI